MRQGRLRYELSRGKVGVVLADRLHDDSKVEGFSSLVYILAWNIFCFFQKERGKTASLFVRRRQIPPFMKLLQSGEIGSLWIAT